MNVIRFCLLLICLNFLISCGQVEVKKSFKERLSSNVFVDNSSSKLTEVATPLIIKQLNQDLEKYTPLIKIVAPQEEQVFTGTDISVELQVKDLPIFQDQKLKLGNHLDLILDNEASQPIYDLEQPIVLKNLSPGTHSLRIFASRAWGESFKNDGAYAQVKFSVLTESGDNRPDADLPLLIYGNPTGTYGAEPFLLDFYLTNAPLHAVAKSNPQLQDWRVKATVNGDSFLLEDWQPVYLSGFNQGENWIQLELIDEKGNNIENVFNNTVRVINYNPQQMDTVSKLFTDKIPFKEAQSIVEQKYYEQPVENLKLSEPQVESKKESEIEDIADSLPVIDISQPTSDQFLESEIQLKEEQNDIPQVTSENNLEVSDTSVAIATSKQKKVNITEENKQSLLPKPTNSAVEAETVQKNFANSSSETKILDPKITEKSDVNVLEANNKQPKTNPATSEPSEPSITLESNEIKITQSESNISNIADSTMDIASIDTNLEQGNEISTTIWWKKILVELRQKIESLVELLPTKA